MWESKRNADECYSFSYLGPTRPHLPVSPAIHHSALILTHHVSATLDFWVLLIHTQLLSISGLLQFFFLSAVLFNHTFSWLTSSGHSVLSSMSPTQLRHPPHLTITVCPLVLLPCLQSPMFSFLTF